MPCSSASNWLAMTQSMSRAEDALGRVSLWRDTDVMVLEFIPGRTIARQTLQSERMVRRMAESFKRLHSSPRFLKDFDMFRLIEYYLRIVEEHEVRIPSDYRQRLPLLAEIERAVQV